MSKPNQSANWDFRFNRRSPSQKEKEKRHECHTRILILHDTWGATVETKKVHIKANVPHPKIKVDTFKKKDATPTIFLQQIIDG